MNRMVLLDYRCQIRQVRCTGLGRQMSFLAQTLHLTYGVVFRLRLGGSFTEVHFEVTTVSTVNRCYLCTVSHRLLKLEWVTFGF